MNCVKSHKEYFNTNITYFDRQYARDTEPFSKVTQYHTSVFLYNSSSVIISNMDVIAIVMKSFTAILIVNIHNVSKIVDVKVKTNSLNCTLYDHQVQISGIVAYYSDGIAQESTLTIKNFYYNNTYESCAHHFHCILTTLFYKIIKKLQV